MAGVGPQERVGRCVDAVRGLPARLADRPPQACTRCVRCSWLERASVGVVAHAVVDPAQPRPADGGPSCERVEERSRVRPERPPWMHRQRVVAEDTLGHSACRGDAQPGRAGRPDASTRRQPTARCPPSLPAATTSPSADVAEPARCRRRGRDQAGPGRPGPRSSPAVPADHVQRAAERVGEKAVRAPGVPAEAANRWASAAPTATTHRGLHTPGGSTGGASCRSSTIISQSTVRARGLQREGGALPAGRATPPAKRSSRRCGSPRPARIARRPGWGRPSRPAPCSSHRSARGSGRCRRRVAQRGAVAGARAAREPARTRPLPLRPPRSHSTPAMAARTVPGPRRMCPVPMQHAGSGRCPYLSAGVDGKRHLRQAGGQRGAARRAHEHGHTSSPALHPDLRPGDREPTPFRPRVQGPVGASAGRVELRVGGTPHTQPPLPPGGGKRSLAGPVPLGGERSVSASGRGGSVESRGKGPRGSAFSAWYRTNASRASGTNVVSYIAARSSTGVSQACQATSEPSGTTGWSKDRLVQAEPVRTDDTPTQVLGEEPRRGVDPSSSASSREAAAG